MKKMLLALGLAAACTANAFAGETLQLKLLPDREVLLKNSPQEVVVKIDLSAIAAKKKPRHTPLNLAVVIDKSGSMRGAKLERTKQAAMQLVDRLAANDVFSLVTFSDHAQVLVAAQKAGDKDAKDALKEKIESIEADGSTALYAGVKLGADQLGEYLSAKRINRVLLLSDGLANVGPSTPRELRRFGSDLAERGIAVTTIGVGDDYNEDLMAGLAEASDSNYYYVQDTEKLPQIFAHEFNEMVSIAVRDVRIEIICPDGVQPLGFIGRPEKFSGQQAVVNLNQLTTGQNRYLFLRCRVNGTPPEIAQAKIHYLDELNGGQAESADGVAKVHFTDDQAAADKSVNGLVFAQKELMLTAVAKDEAIAQADAGNYKQAAAILQAQNRALGLTLSDAPASAQQQIRAETDNLNTLTGDISSAGFGGGSFNGSATRKTIQAQSYNTRNSK
ncbi:MAG TPA: VWA domain-containing protein [Verrucomicrobiae bacterium]|jgi:Ca-activated chloride channel family protein